MKGGLKLGVLFFLASPKKIIFLVTGMARSYLDSKYENQRLLLLI